MGKYTLFILGILAITFFFSPQKVKAVDTDIVINEVMANALGDDTSHEWIELANFGTNSFDLVTWQLKIYNDPSSTDPKRTISFSPLTLNPGDILVITSNANIYKPCAGCLIYDGQFSSTAITNSKGKIALIDVSRGYEYDFSWNYDVGDGYSMELIGPPQDPSFIQWQKSLNPGGTPGEENSEVIIEPPIEYPEEVLELVNIDTAIIKEVQVISIVDGDTIKVTGLEAPFSSTIRLLYADTPEKDLPFYDTAKIFTQQLVGQTVDLLISEAVGEQMDLYDRTLVVVIFQDKVFNTQLLGQGLASFYDYDNSVVQSDKWLSILQEAQEARIGLWEASGDIILSELLPNPEGDDATGEWVEIYNPADIPIDLSRFVLDQYLIPSGTSILPLSYLVLYRTVTEVTLNNTGDTVKLFFPGGLTLDEVNYSESSESLAWARDTDGGWEWTETLTPGWANDIYLSPEDDDNDGMGGEDEGTIIINTVPIEIKTGEFRDFNQKLVAVTGTVITTSGNTFYLDDGTGQAKIYLQESKGIDKPPMHKGDIFAIIGIVNLYRNTWRLLPQKQSDVKLVKCIKDDDVDLEVASENTSKTTTNSSTAGKTTAQARAPTSNEMIVKQVKAAEDTPTTEKKSVKASWWLQITKVLVGLAVIFLILLIIKARRHPKVKIIGGHFGDDET